MIFTRKPSVVATVSVMQEPWKNQRGSVQLRLELMDNTGSMRANTFFYANKYAELLELICFISNVVWMKIFHLSLCLM